MKIIYIASVFNNDCLDRYYGGKPVLSYTACKYNALLFDGLAENGIETKVLSVVPIDPSKCNKKFLRGFRAHRKNLEVQYLSQYNIPIFKNFINAINVFFRTIFAPADTVVVYDALVIAASIGAIAAAKFRKFPKVGIVTDLPRFQQISKSSLGLRINNKVLNMADGYVFLTKYMNAEVNKLDKPYLILEGHADAEMTKKTHKAFTNESQRIIYAGSLMKIYGIELLCKAFIKYSKPNEELHIYGMGDYEGEVRTLQCEHRNIIYHGNCPNAEVVEAELSATLLVNPRPTSDEYTKYSFPSKTLEYMASGTPVLTSRLVGIPAEYAQYIFFFDDNSVDSLGRKIREILDLPVQTLKEIGSKAKEFALGQKSNTVQAGKVIALCKELKKTNL